MVFAATDPGHAVTSAVLIAVVGACILIPMWLRQRMVEKQLDAVTKAMEKGVDPEQVLKHVRFKHHSDINGNWKAGRFLTFVGFIICAPLLLAALHDNELFGLLLICLVFPLSGVALLMIHKRIVGDVVKYDPKTSGNSDHNGGSSPDPS